MLPICVLLAIATLTDAAVLRNPYSLLVGIDKKLDRLLAMQSKNHIKLPESGKYKLISDV